MNLPPRILVTHPWMAHGGSEAVAMWTLQALQDRARVTFLTASSFDPDRMNEIYGTTVRKDRIEIRKAPAVPGVNSAIQLVHFQRSLFERHCRTLAPRFDLCISTYNPVDFGRPAIQIIGDFSFSEELRNSLYPTRKSVHRESLLRKLYLGASRLLRRMGVPLVQPTDRILANSHWSADLLKVEFDIHHAPVLYPPVLLPDPERISPVNRDPLGFVSIGRIAPEKEIEKSIEILERVREAGHPVSLTLLGRFDDSDYSNQIAALVTERREWIRTPGFLDAREKRAVLESCSFAIHSCRIEAFGISVAEMAAAGCLPIVPAEGGASEIVARSALQYSQTGEAAEKIIALLEERSHAEKTRNELMKSTDRFSPANFMRQLRREVDRFLGKSSPKEKSRHARKAVSTTV